MKEQQKQNLIDMMKDDEKLGLYNETLEEAAAEFAKNHSIYPTAQDDTEYGFINGAKWQEERMYSEEEVLVLLYKRDAYNFKNNAKSLQEWETPKEWFEQFKKK